MSPEVLATPVTSIGNPKKNLLVCTMGACTNIVDFRLIMRAFAIGGRNLRVSISAVISQSGRNNIAGPTLSLYHCNSF
ncbi:hypothetical protein RHMOL_Rhmol04G0363600 [Rhododendron molle]|uniref:Uncharacterized protein n=1 Tax=Rhododendron molle TaxID=49168 RepID=A0ACC0P9L1_RHOML|nr:hypothetical protein RHMOL_Rhmol04G0363600 [Rhododendron molle]